MILRRAFILAPVVIFLWIPVYTSQGQSLAGEVWQSIRGIILPEYVSATYDLRDFIESQPAMPYTRESHLERLDRIWSYAVYITDGDIETALFITTVATIPYYTFPAYIPLVGLPITIPVSTESREAFDRRFENLPTILYRDSPSGGDRDKLPHFFGAAYIQYRSRSPFLAAISGEFIEIAEKLFKLEGAYDIRDIDVNYRGIAFGTALRNRLAMKPSEFFNESIPGDVHEPR